MILSFFDQTTKDIFDGKNTKKTQKLLPAHLHEIAHRKLDMLQAADDLEDLRIAPTNRLKKLSGARGHQYSISIDESYQIAFTWKKDNAEDVEILES